MIKVLITEDSQVVRKYLRNLLSKDPEIEVVGIARDGQEAVQMVYEHKPDVVSMDIHMPRMDGLEATRKIMETQPVPIVICSASWDPEEVEKTFRVMEAGAVAAVAKPVGMGSNSSQQAIRELVQTVKTMARVKVIRRWARKRPLSAAPPSDKSAPEEDAIPASSPFDIVGVGTSTGGPMALKRLFGLLRRPFPCPIVVVQHIADGFLQGLGEWLTDTTGFPVKIAADGDKMAADRAYLAPNGFQMEADRYFRVKLIPGDSETEMCPSVSHLFRNLADTFGKKCAGVLLTGMGKDGALELKYLKDRGGTTFAQDKESSIVHGMPGEAIRLGATDYVMNPERIAVRLGHLIRAGRPDSVVNIPSQ
jgi:two-component system chemotaxis response regulator CheB